MKILYSYKLTVFCLLLFTVYGRLVLYVDCRSTRKDEAKFVVSRKTENFLNKIGGNEFAQNLVNAAPKNVANILREMGTNENHLETSENTEKKKRTLLWTSARRKRSTNSQRQNGIQKCHSGRVYVNLANFQNVIAPSGFYTHYCGETYSLPIGNSTIVQTLSRAFVEAYKTVTTIPPKVLANPSCCVPKKFHSLYILHLEENGMTTLKPIPNIKASRCVCKKRQGIIE